MNPAVAPLAGVRVVEAGSYIAAPFAGHMLAQLGASVTKIEPPDGDRFRTFAHRRHGLSAAWVNVNHGKNSVFLDLKTRADVARARSLLANADVFIHNWRPGVATTLGLDPDQELEANPTLVYVSVSGFGATGPNADAPVFDTILQASTGLIVAESRQERPNALRSFIADKTTALYVVQVVLAALHQRARTGSGCRVDVSMLDVMAHFNFPDLFQERTFLEEEHEPFSPPAPSAVCRTSDGWICVAPVQARHFVAMATCLDRPEWIDHFKAITSQRELVSELVRLADSETTTRTTEECLRLFAGADVPAVRVTTPDEHLSDPQTRHNALYDEVTCNAGLIRRVRHPMLIDGHPLPHVDPPPGGPVE